MKDRQMASITKLLQSASDRQKDAAGETSAFNILSVLQLELMHRNRSSSTPLMLCSSGACPSRVR